jgi:hypothetical protein
MSLPKRIMKLRHIDIPSEFYETVRMVEAYEAIEATRRFSSDHPDWCRSFIPERLATASRR